MTSRRPPTATASGQPEAGMAGAWLSAEQFARLRDLLAGYSGVYLDPTRQRLLENGLAQRLQATGDDLAAYEQRLAALSGRAELHRLAKLVLNHETVFFRNMPHIQALREVLLPEIHQRKPSGAPIRIWSAGCATGEEPYSLALIALETLGRPLARPVDIWATDLSEHALQKAREGVYRGRAIQNLPPELLRRYFKPSDDGYAIADTVRALVRFDALNLLEPFPRDAWDVDIIFCQNVMIYFQLKTSQQLIARFYEHLAQGGLLFLGFSETLWNVFDRFYTREVGGAYVYSKGALEATAPMPKADLQALESHAHIPPNQPARRPVKRQSQPGCGKPAGVPLDRAKVFDHIRAFPAHVQTDDDTLAAGRALIDQGQIDPACELLRRISPRSALAPQALTLMARAYADRDELELAAAEIQRAIAIDPLNDQAYLLSGLIASRQGQWGAAIQQLERARYLSAESALVSFHLAEAYRQAGQTERAVREYRSALRKLEHHPPGDVLDGVAVGWLRDTCRRHIADLPHLR